MIDRDKKLEQAITNITDYVERQTSPLPDQEALQNIFIAANEGDIAFVNQVCELLKSFLYSEVELKKKSRARFVISKYIELSGGQESDVDKKFDNLIALFSLLKNDDEKHQHLVRHLVTGFARDFLKELEIISEENFKKLLASLLHDYKALQGGSRAGADERFMEIFKAYAEKNSGIFEPNFKARILTIIREFSNEENIVNLLQSIQHSLVKSYAEMGFSTARNREIYDLLNEVTEFAITLLPQNPTAASKDLRLICLKNIAKIDFDFDEFLNLFFNGAPQDPYKMRSGTRVLKDDFESSCNYFESYFDCLATFFKDTNYYITTSDLTTKILKRLDNVIGIQSPNYFKVRTAVLSSFLDSHNGNDIVKDDFILLLETGLGGIANTNKDSYKKSIRDMIDVLVDDARDCALSEQDVSEIENYFFPQEKSANVLESDATTITDISALSGSTTKQQGI